MGFDANEKPLTPNEKVYDNAGRVSSMHVFPDTNILLHYRPLAEIDWKHLCGANEITLVFCLKVIHELDEKKSDVRLSSRATRAIKDIREAKQSGRIKSGISLKIFNYEPRQADFEVTLSPDSADDHIVHSALHYAKVNHIDNLCIATGDLGMEIRCDAHGIRTITPSDEDKLENPIDETQKKLRALQQDNEALKNRSPRLSLSIRAEGQEIAKENATFLIEDLTATIDIEALVSAQELKYPKRYDGSRRSDAPNTAIAAMMDELETFSPHWEYNRDVDRYLNELRERAIACDCVQQSRSRTFTFELVLRNDGRGIATEIDVDLSILGSHFRIFEKGSRDAAFLEYPSMPLPPSENSDYFKSYLSASRLIQAATIPLPYSTQIDGSTIQCRFQKLKHGHERIAGSFHVVFDTIADIKPLTMKYHISSTENIEKATGQLHAIVTFNGKHPDSQ